MEKILSLLNEEFLKKLADAELEKQSRLDFQKEVETLRNQEINTNVKVVYDPESFNVIGYYPINLNYSKIPEPNIEITKEKHFELIQNGMPAKIIDGVIVQEEPINTESFDFVLNNKKLFLRALNQKYILNVYPDTTQRNITARATEDLLNSFFETDNTKALKEMNAFILERVEKYNKIVSDIEKLSLTDLKKLDSDNLKNLIANA